MTDNNPAIRFAGFNNPWERRKLSEIYASIGNAFVGTATPYYVDSGHFYLESNNVKDGQINRNTEIFINDDFYEKQKDKWLHTGDMVMVQSGHVGHAAVIPEELDNLAAHALIMFRNPKVKIYPYFLNYQYQTIKTQKKIENITTGNTIKHILASDMQDYVVDVPSFDEQEIIGDYFLNLDHLITLHQRKYERLLNVKKSMLKKMFPPRLSDGQENGSNLPEIRFAGFTDALPAGRAGWEQRKLEEISEQVKDTVDPQLTPDTTFYEYSMPAFDDNSEPDIVIGYEMNSIRKVIDVPCLLISVCFFLPKRLEIPINSRVSG